MPTQRSVAARLRNKSLDGGWSDDSLWRATRIRVFPRNATIDNKIFKAETHISWFCVPSLISAEQKNSSYSFLLRYQYKLCAYLFSFSAFKSRTCWSAAKHVFYVCYQVNSSQVAQKQNKTKQPKMTCLALFRNQNTYTGPVSQSSYPVLNATLMPMSTEYALPWKPDFDRQKTTDPV